VSQRLNSADFISPTGTRAITWRRQPYGTGRQPQGY